MLPAVARAATYQQARGKLRASSGGPDALNPAAEDPKRGRVREPVLAIA
jgi:hypothetical protein